MASVLSNVVKNNASINDEVIAANMLTAAKGTVNAYLNATMTSPTPELRAMYSNSLSQVVSGHTALTELSIKRGWEQPYDKPSEQLSNAYEKADTVIDNRK